MFHFFESQGEFRIKTSGPISTVQITYTNFTWMDVEWMQNFKTFTQNLPEILANNVLSMIYANLES